MDFMKNCIMENINGGRDSGKKRWIWAWEHSSVGRERESICLVRTSPALALQNGGEG